MLTGGVKAVGDLKALFHGAIVKEPFEGRGIGVHQRAINGRKFRGQLNPGAVTKGRGLVQHGVHRLGAGGPNAIG